MYLINSINILRDKVLGARLHSKTIGFVPTMGALHRGHIRLVESARKECDYVVCSIFINPAQFNNTDDFKNYPVRTDQDKALLEVAGCDLLFLPESNTMYPSKGSVKIEAGEIANHLEGAYRPGHFNGVLLIVSKLFNIVWPDVAYFGRKDLQQVRVISKMIQDLNYPIKLRIVETEREPDGLAMSSRNLLLTPKERAVAPILYQVLSKAKEKLKNEPFIEVKSWASKQFENTGITLEYFELVDDELFAPLQEIKDGASLSLCISAYIGKVRLIDNIALNS